MAAFQFVIHSYSILLWIFLFEIIYNFFIIYFILNSF
jgi:hypothetical protein